MSIVMPRDVDKKAIAVSLPRQPAEAGNFHDLYLRILSGVTLVPLALLFVYLGVIAFAVLVLAVSLIMIWEWGHLVRGDVATGPRVWGTLAHLDAPSVVQSVAIATSIGLTAGGHASAAFLALLVASLAMIPVTLANRPLLSAFGILYVGLAAVALVWLRGDVALGLTALVFLLAIVWTTDTMAFVFGRLLGGARLWPSISPNKTWAGFLGGVGSSGLVGGVAGYAIVGSSSLRLAAIAVVLGVVAQAGDLGESALKRAFGVKDASSLIPGHGGLMDRMDGVVTVAVAAALFALLWNVESPARALLIGE